MDKLYISIFIFLYFLQNATCDKYYCPLMIAVDETFYVHSNSDIKNVTKISQNLVERMNQVFLEMEAVPIFELKELRILPQLCKDSECSSLDIKTYLTEFKKLETSEFCLAFLLTYQDFEGTEGYAYTSSLCTPKDNVGFITALNRKKSANFESLVKSLSHEIGHSLGASHTEETSCKTGQYLMSTEANRSNPVTTLSECTKKTIDQFLNKDAVDQLVRRMAKKTTKRDKKLVLSRISPEDVNGSRLVYCLYMKLLKEKSSNGNLKIMNPLKQKLVTTTSTTSTTTTTTSTSTTTTTTTLTSTTTTTIKNNDETSTTPKSGSTSTSPRTTIKPRSSGSTVSENENDFGTIIAVISCLSVLLLILAIALIYDWKTKKRCFQCKRRNDQFLINE